MTAEPFSFAPESDFAEPTPANLGNTPADLEQAFRRAAAKAPQRPDCMFMARYERDRQQAANVLGLRYTTTNHGATIQL